jgi:hypothetical protein
MRRWLFIVLLALPLAAQTRHQIFKIEFRSRIPASILLSQSGLSQDHTYTDDELEIGASRLRRLPFVYSVSYKIDGSTLVFEVSDEHRVFFGIDTLVQVTGGNLGGGGGFLNAALGGRYYLPWGGLVQGTYGLESASSENHNTWTARYAQYGIAGSRLFVILEAADSLSGNSGILPRFQVGYPITLRQTITFSGFRTKSSTSERNGLAGVFETSMDVGSEMFAWRWDTTNDPLFATKGAAFTVGVGRTTNKNTALATLSPTRPLFSSDSLEETNDYHLGAQKFWNFGRGAITGSLDTVGNVGTLKSRSKSTDPYHSLDRNSTATSALVGYVYNFFPSVSTFRYSRHRLEFAAGINDHSSETGTRKETSNLFNAQLGYAYRNHWLNFHFVVGYLTD